MIRSQLAYEEKHAGGREQHTGLSDATPSNVCGINKQNADTTLGQPQQRYLGRLVGALDIDVSFLDR